MSKPRASLASVKNTPPLPHPVDNLASPQVVTQAAVPPPPGERPAADAVEAGKGTTVHLTKAAAKELKKLAADRDTTVHALMIEGINLVFQQYGIQHTATAGPRPDAVRKLASKKSN